MPSLDSITPDQYQSVIIGLSAERTAVVTGVAGSGKSSLCLIKAKQVAVQTESYAIIVYTKSLKQFFKEELNEIDPTGKHVYHYHQWLATPNKPHYDYLFIDECQDFTSEDITNFTQHGTYCWFFGDTDQTIMKFKDRSPQSVEATVRQLNISRSNFHPLAINYRLTIENAGLAEYIGRQFNSQLRLVDACIKHGPFPVLIQTNDQLRYLLDWCTNHSGDDIGILAYFNEQVEVIKKYFEENSTPVQWKTHDNMYINFQSTSPKIITWHCAKGLQFENVFIPYAGTDDYDYNFINPFVKCKPALYVACSRPLTWLRILHSTTPCNTFPRRGDRVWGSQDNPF